VTGTFAVVTGGGTAGHVLPALAVADALVHAGHDASEIHYVGATRGVETRLLPATPYPHTFLDVVGVQRRLTRRNLGFAPKLWRARRQAIALCTSLRPRVVVSVGGYASLPAVLAARRLGIPVVVVSYDRTPGRASQLAARWASASAVAFAGSPLPRSVETGAPVRAAVLRVDRDRDRLDARRSLGISADAFCIGVLGGSLGSDLLNRAVCTYVRDRRDDGSLAVYHLAGTRFDVEPVSAPPGAAHHVVGYQEDMAAVYAAVDVLVGRGGASTVHEVAVTGTPAVLVPWAAAADDHQTDNVRWLSDADAAVLLAEEPSATFPGRLASEIDALRADPDRRARLGRAAWASGSANRSGRLAALIEDVAGAAGDAHARPSLGGP
jgi:UDP-N-acetylglucosamine:LPS N-acetylglucosamine transferase